MIEWLDANADGIAFMLWACIAGLLVLGVAWAIELYQSREMRRRRKRAAAYRRYVASLTPNRE